MNGSASSPLNISATRSKTTMAAVDAIHVCGKRRRFRKKSRERWIEREGDGPPAQILVVDTLGSPRQSGVQ